MLWEDGFDRGWMEKGRKEVIGVRKINTNTRRGQLTAFRRVFWVGERHSELWTNDSISSHRREHFWVGKVEAAPCVRFCTARHARTNCWRIAIRQIFAFVRPVCSTEFNFLALVQDNLNLFPSAIPATAAAIRDLDEASTRSAGKQR